LFLIGICLFALLSIQATNASFVFGSIAAIILIYVVIKDMRKKKNNGCSAGGSGCGSRCAGGVGVGEIESGLCYEFTIWVREILCLQ
jgi:uncharacterized membrane protein